jgi:hypothetical protein
VAEGSDDDEEDEEEYGEEKPEVVRGSCPESYAIDPETYNLNLKS